jgi:hypothetical protein
MLEKFTAERAEFAEGVEGLSACPAFSAVDYTRRYKLVAD